MKAVFTLKGFHKDWIRSLSGKMLDQRNFVFATASSDNTVKCKQHCPYQNFLIFRGL